MWKIINNVGKQILLGKKQNNLGHYQKADTTWKTNIFRGKQITLGHYQKAYTTLGSTIPWYDYMKRKILTKILRETIKFIGIFTMHVVVFLNIIWTNPDVWPGAAYRSMYD